MSSLRVVREYYRLRRSQRLDAAAIRRLRERKLRRIVRHAYENVPFYREQFERASVTPDMIRRLEDLPLLPIITRRDFQAAGVDATTSSAFSADELTDKRTSGSTGRPLTIRWDRRWAAIQKALFLRALFAAGYRLGDRIVILTDDPVVRSTPGWLGWRYLGYGAAPENLLAGLNAFRPAVIYGWVTPLRRLALHARANEASPHRPKVIVTTAEALDRETRHLIRDVFGAETFEVYGLTEMGTVATECFRHDGLHLSEETVIAEIPDLDQGAAVSRLILTNLDLMATPFIRYETGDIVRTNTPGRCGCGNASHRIASVQGRAVDCVRLPDGRSLLPYDFTLAIEQIDGVDRFRVVQNGLHDFTVHHEGATDGAGAREERIGNAVRRLVGADARVSVRRMDNLDPPPGQKFRIVESRLAMSGSIARTEGLDFERSESDA